MTKVILNGALGRMGQMIVKAAMSDGAVEIVVEGPRYAVDSMIEWAKQGPYLAEVTDVNVRFDKPRDEFETFMIRD